MAGEVNQSRISGVLDGNIGGWGGSAADLVQQTQSAALARAAVERTRAHLKREAAAMQSATHPAPAQATPGSGSGYHFDAETIAQRIKDWQKVVDDITRDRFELEGAIRFANPPSPDKPALQNAQKTRESIQAAIDQNIAMRQYAQAWLDALHKANGTYVEHDQDTGKGLSGAGSATDGSKLNS
ncbi:hypothetical protein [Amycolatopsis taiwanensis]|uniref:Uncharacterized protein n=1 Tax=Amycolatopsis taiwanensis TaxID=342230 RepID=A0A9W6VAY7_9PSEU|nr:hypothetical protein [Amycolatopsis taiwanensis]GLY64358.1 hypothetical protein Atai01_09770 [Amycolatopsis taiwanensis]